MDKLRQFYAMLQGKIKNLMGSHRFIVVYGIKKAPRMY
jgi:hypothetical protein